MDKKIYGDTFKLNRLQVRRELAEVDKPYAWLARKIGISRQAFWYSYSSESIKHVEKMAGVFGVPVTRLLDIK